MKKKPFALDKALIALLSLSIIAVTGLCISYPLVTSRSLLAEQGDEQAMLRQLVSLPQQIRDQLAARETMRLIAEPLDISALNNLAILNSLTGDTSVTTTLLRLAANRSLHDVLAQFVAMKEDSTAEQYDSSFAHADALLTSTPAIKDQVYALLLTELQKEKAQQALSKILLRDPPWRMGFFNWLIEQEPTGETSYALFSGIRKLGGKIDPAEMHGVLAQLFKIKAYDRAYYLWLDSLPPLALKKVSTLFDGDFSLEPQNQYFDWNIEHAQSVEIGLTPSAINNAQRNLHLYFYHSTKYFSQVFQYTKLEPGSYKMMGQWSAMNFTSEGGLSWKMKCLEKSSVAGTSANFKTSNQQENFTFDITIPPDGCNTQIIALLSSSEAVLDAKTDGEIIFSNLQIRPKSEGGQ